MAEELRCLRALSRVVSVGGRENAGAHPFGLRLDFVHGRCGIEDQGIEGQGIDDH